MKLKKKEVEKLETLVADLSGKAIDDIAVCDVIKTAEMLLQLADDWFCPSVKGGEADHVWVDLSSTLKSK